MNSKTLRVMAILLLATPCFSAQDVQTPEPAFSIAPAARWVAARQIASPKNDPRNLTPYGYFFLIYDNQRLITHRESHQYYRIAKKIIHDKGIDHGAKIMIDFDPNYERLTIHEICVRRGRTALQKLRKDRVNLYQREERLEYRIYDGRKTAHVLLDDIRDGDIVDYSYTISGQNPVLDNRYYDSFFSRLDVPIYQIHNRILVSPDRDIFIKNHGTEVEPTISEAGGYKEYRWSFSAMTPITVESETPDWYNPYPWVQITDAKSWNDIASWSARKYRVPKEQSEDLMRQIKEISAAASTAEDRALGALHFVQDKIRYTAIMMGPGAYAPTDPSVVIKRRFGDCKDKALLLLTLLRGLGIDAQPALVNTSKREHIKEYLPSPGAFNHVIVHATVGGNEYWLDPTMYHQGGDLKHISPVDYGLALIVSIDTSKLVGMGGKGAVSSTKVIEELFDLTAGMDKAASFKVTSTFSGEEADSFRYNLAGRSPAEIQKQYINFYSRYFSGIATTQPMRIKDDSKSNSISVTETYRIHDFFKHNKANSRREFAFEPFELYMYIKKPNMLKRTMPLTMKHPVHVTNKTVVKLPEDWNIETGCSTIRNDFFRLEQCINYKDRILNLTYDYRSMKDHIPAEKLAKYLKDIESCTQELGFSLYKSDTSVASATKIDNADSALSTAGALAILFVFLFIPSGIVVFRMHRYYLKKNREKDLSPPAARTAMGDFNESADGTRAPACASSGKRLANYLLDTFGVVILYSYIWVFVGVMENLNIIAKDSINFIFTNILFLILFKILYFVAFEGIFSKTPAKFFTRTRVVLGNGTRPSLRSILIRSLCRFIPFNIFSFLGSSRPVGWHDSISKTRVVDDGE